MKISTKGRYALEAVLDLALTLDKAHVSLKEISERRNISETYLEQIFVKIKKNGIVTSVRGAQGGYKLQRSPKDISVGDIVRAVEGPLAAVKCTDDPKECAIANDCMTKSFWGEVTFCINDTLDGITIEDLISKTAELKNEIAYDYYI